MGDYYDKLGYSADEVPTDIRYIANKNRKKKDWVGAAFDEAMSPMAMKRTWDRKTRSTNSEPDWKIDEQTESELQRDYSEHEEKYLKEAKSKSEFIARKKDIAEDRARESAIAENGMKGLMGTLAFSLIDPVGIGLGMLSGGVGWGAEMTGLAKTLRVAATTGTENAILATALTAGNTQADATDIVTAFGTGAIIGAGLSPFVRARNPRLAESADAADAAAHIDAESAVIDDTVSRIRDKEVIVQDVIDHRLVKAELDNYEESLKVQEKPLNKGQTSKIESEIKDIEESIKSENEKMSIAQEDVKSSRENIVVKEKEYVESVNKKKAEIEEAYAERIAAQEKVISDLDESLLGRKNETKRAIKIWEEETKLEDIKAERAKEIKAVEAETKKSVYKAKTDFNRKLNAKIKKNKETVKILREQLKENTNRLKGSKDIKQKQNDLRKWKQMTYEEQVSHVYSDKELPTKKAELDRQISNIEATENEHITPSDEPLSATGTDSTVHEPKATEEGSAGAMKAGDKEDNPFYDTSMQQRRTVAMFAHDGAEMPDDLRGRLFLGKRNWFTEKIYAAQTFISNSKDYAIRGFGYHLFEAPQGGTAAKVTVGARVRNYTQQIRSAMRNRMNEGVDEWADEQGMSKLSLLKGSNREKYYKMVMQEIKHPGMYDSEAVRKGAAGVKDQLGMAGKIRSDAGESGFENLDIYKNYVPVVMDSLKVKYAVLEHGTDKVKAVLSKAYQEGHFKLEPDLADRIAEGYIKRAQDHTLTITEHIRRTSDKDVTELAKALKKAGVDDETITDFLDTNMQKEARQYMSDRAKKSLYPSLESEANGLKMIDLVESDLPKLVESYTRDAAGGAAFAKLGFKTKMQVMDCLADIEKSAVNNGMSHTEVAKELQILRDGVTLAYGRSLNEDAYSPFVRNLSRIRAMTGLVMLQYFGLASIPELARSLTQRGVRDTLSACKNLGALGTKSLRKGGKYSGVFNRSDLRELENILGYQGEDFVLYPKHLRLGNIEETEEGSRIGRFIDNALSQGQRIQEVLSGFRLVQGSGEKIAARSLGSQIKKWALESGEALSKANIDRAGWSDNFLDDLKAWMLKNPATDTFNGKEIKLFNFGKMPADMQERLQIGMHRLLAGDMQRNLLGENPMSMHRWLGQTIMQFRNFSMLSLEKQLVHDVRQQPMVGSMIFLNSIFLAYLTLAAQTLHVGLGKDNQDEYIQKHLSSKATKWYVLSKMGQLASVQTGMDLMATFGLLPDSMMGTTYSPGGRTLTSGTIPAVGMVNDILKGSRDLASMVIGQKDNSEVMKQLRRVVPFAKTVGINQALNVIEKDIKD